MPQQISTAGHGPSKGLSGINNHLKEYFRKKKDRHQLRMDQAWSRAGRYAHVNHTEALMRGQRRRKVLVVTAASGEAVLPEWLRD